MYKPLYMPYSALTAPLLEGALILPVMAGLRDYINNVLGPADWSYLKVKFLSHTEIIKVWGTSDSEVNIAARAQDNTEEYSFPTGSIVTFVDTAAGVLDSYAPQPLQLDQLGAVEIYEGRIAYPDLTFAVSEGTEILGDDPSILIAARIKAYGCCPPRNTDA